MTKKINNYSLKLLISNCLYRWWRNIFQIFLNIYLWKITNDIQLLAMFNIYFLSWHMLWYIINSFYVKLWNRKLLNLLSFLWLIFSYLLIIILWEQVINHIYLIWILFWIFNGSYYINYWVNQFDLTTFKNRWNFEWMKKALKTISKMIFPGIFWIIISFYNINIAFFVWILFFILAFFISNISFKHSVWKIHYKKFFKIIKNNNKILYSIFWSFFFTLAFSIPLLDLLIPLLIYKEVWTELKLWFSLSFLSFLSILIIYLFWRFIDYKHYNKSLIILCLVYIFSLLWLVFFQTYSLFVITSSIVISVVSLYWLITSVITNNSLHSIKNFDDYKVEFLVLKEIWYFFWWIIWFILMYFSWWLSRNSMHIIFYSMIFFSIISTIFLININMHDIEKD